MMLTALYVALAVLGAVVLAPFVALAAPVLLPVFLLAGLVWLVRLVLAFASPLRRGMRPSSARHAARGAVSGDELDERRKTSRGKFLAGLLVGAGSVAVAVRIGTNGDEKSAEIAPTVTAVVTSHPRVRVASLSALGVGDVVDFEYPTAGAQASLFKLGRRADGGIGPDDDVVAFSTACTHMGCPLRGLFIEEHAIIGPCPCHFTTFDPAHRGMVVLGQATENLPQILLDLEGDDVLAVGTLGILYGFRNNLADVPLVEGL